MSFVIAGTALPSSTRLQLPKYSVSRPVTSCPASANTDVITEPM